MLLSAPPSTRTQLAPLTQPTPPALCRSLKRSWSSCFPSAYVHPFHKEQTNPDKPAENHSTFNNTWTIWKNYEKRLKQPKVLAIGNVLRAQFSQSCFYGGTPDQGLQDTQSRGNEALAHTQIDSVEKVNLLKESFAIWVMHQNPCKHRFFVPRGHCLQGIKKSWVLTLPQRSIADRYQNQHPRYLEPTRSM